MSYSDDFFKELNKKNKKNKKEENDTTKNKTRSNSGYANEFYSALNDDIAPLPSTATRYSELAPTVVAPAGGEKDSWFKTGGFSDGIDGVGDFFGDLGETVAGTVGDLGLGMVKGVGRTVEGIVDLGTYAVGGIGGLLGFDDFKEKAKDVARYSAVDEWTKPATDFLDQYSVLGNKADMVSEGLGQVAAILLTAGAGAAAGLGSAGVTALTTGVTGLSSMGTGIGNAYNEGANDAEAFLYGLGSGAIEAGTELLSGGLGKAVKALGISRGIGGLDDIFAKKLSSTIVKSISNESVQKVLGNTIEAGIKAGGEGVEEVLSGLGSAVMKWLTYEKDEDIKKLIEDEDLLEQFVVGAITSSIAQGADYVKANKSGRDFVTGYTNNEQAVIDKEVEKRVSEKEKNGKKLSNKEIGAIEEQVQNDMEHGQLNIETIEEVLGGEKYTAYKDTVKNEEALKAEYDRLADIKKSDLTTKQEKRLAELEAMNLDDTTKRNSLRKELNDTVFPQLNNSKLAESYKEIERQDQKFEVDLTKYKGKQREAVERAVKSGVLNNTYRSHVLVDTLSRIEADKGITFDYTNNKKLKESGFAVEGVRVNGYANKSTGTVTLNVQSKKAWQSVVGHEITHILKDTKHYTALKDALFAYAESKGELANRRTELTELYQNMDADVDEELTADLVGDYLFTDKAFINRLTGNRTLFQKVYDEIKYLWSVATGKEKADIEKVKHEFDRAWKEVSAKDVKETGGKNQYSLTADDLKVEAARFVSENADDYGDSWGFRVDNYDYEIGETMHKSHELYQDAMYDDDGELLYPEGEGVYSGFYDAGELDGTSTVGFDAYSRDLETTIAEALKTTKRYAYDDKKYLYIVSGDNRYGGTDIGESIISGATVLKKFRINEDGTYDEITSEPDIRYSPSKNGGKVQYSVSAETDADYMSAVERGDTETAQRMVDEAAKKAGYTRKLYHGTASKFNVFGFGRTGIFTTDNFDMAKTYGNNVMSLYGKEGANVLHIDARESPHWSIEVSKDVLDFSEYPLMRGKDRYSTNDISLIAFREGYDVVVIDNVYDNFSAVSGNTENGLGTDVVYKDPNQVKSSEAVTYDDNGNVIPLSQRFNENNDDIRFSLSKNVEETKDLMALHNLQSSELLKTLELGGLPMPSVAVIKAEQGHEQYGDVSLILPKETIDPALNKDNKVYGGDAWTPTYPRIEYKANEAVQKRVRDKYYELEHKYGNEVAKPLYRYAYELESALNTEQGEANLLDWLYNDTKLMQAYLEDSGKGKVEDIVKETRTEATESEKQLNQWFIDKLGEDFIRAFKTPKGESPISYIKNYIENHKAEIASAWESYCREVYKFNEEETQNVVSNTKGADYMKFMRNAEQYLSNGGVTIKTETDYNATERAIEEKAADGYKEWIDGLFKGAEEKTGIRNDKDAFTSSGNRRGWDALHWENTLENVVKAMKAQDQTGADAFSPASSIFAVAQKRYNSIEDIKADSGRLGRVTEEEYKALQQEYASRLVEIADSIKNTSERNPFVASDRAAQEIIDAVRNYKTKSGMLRYMQKWNSRVTASTVDDILSLVSDIANMPTGYFEAKPQRAVGLDEVGVYVIPNNIDAKLKQELLNRGYSIAEYDPNVDGDRKRVVNQFEEYKFSLSDANEQYAPVGNYSTPFNELAYNEDVAPVVESKPKVEPERYETIRPRRAAKPTVEEDIAPIGENVEYGDKSVRVDSPFGKERKWVGTSTESKAVNRGILPDNLDQKKIHYQPISNKTTLGKANAQLDGMGYESSVSYFNNQFKNKSVSLEDVALGERLIQEAMKRGDTKTAGELIQNVAILGTELGQKVQALSIIKRLTPEGQIGMLKKTIERGKAKGDKAFEGVELTQEMIDKILKVYGKDGTYDQKKLNEAVENVKKDIADQMKVTKMDKVNAWRYLSMLGNPKTHIRNLVSNVAMKGTVAVKNVVARTIESVAPIKNRTKTWKAASDDVKAFADKTTAEMKDILSDGGKYSESESIKQKRQIFKNKILNGLYEFNSDMLSKEDWWFSKPAFKNALSEYLTANGINTAEDIQNNPEVVEKAKHYATEQSQIATFRQYSYLANKISEFERHNAGTQMTIGAILPFKKTPINIAKTGLNYSPLGFVKTLTSDASKVKNGKMEASELVDHLSQNITGTALTLIGYMLASAGFISGGGEDDKEGDYDFQLGKQSYSVNIGGNSYSLSWLSPVAMPLFVGANAYEQLVEGKEWNGDVVVETLAQTLDPLSEMSFLSGLNQVLSSYDSGIEKFAGIGEAMIQNYATQFVPTLMSQVAQVTDDTKRSTKVAADSDFRFVDETINKLKYKIPGLRQTLEPTTDIWGNEVKQTENVIRRAIETFIAPYSKRENIATEIDAEIKSLYGLTGDDGIIPSIPRNTVNYKDVKYEMSASDYTAYKKTYGQTAYDLMEKLFDLSVYQNASAEEKADMVNKVYDYANDVAKKELLAKRGVKYTNVTKDNVEYYKEDAIKGAIENNMIPEEYSFYQAYPDKHAVAKAVGGYSAYKTYSSELYDIKPDKDANGKSISGSRKEKVINYINNLDADYYTKIILLKSEFPSDDTYNADIVNYVINSDFTYDEKASILTELGFRVTADGEIYAD